MSYYNVFIQTKLNQKYPIHTFQTAVLELIKGLSAQLLSSLLLISSPLQNRTLHKEDTSISFCITINTDFKPKQLSHINTVSPPPASALGVSTGVLKDDSIRTVN